MNSRFEWRRLCGLILLLLLGGCAAGEENNDEPSVQAAWFEEVSRELGIDFEHIRAEEVRYYLPEIMSGGAAWIDYDGDGFLDLYVVQGGVLGDYEGAFPSNRLYKNLGGKRFEDVTDKAGVGDTAYGMGVTVGDYDRDGDPDLYVTNVGANVLFRNEGNGRFVDVTREAAVGNEGWGTSAVFADYDRDGWLDLYVVNYINWSPERELDCSTGGAGQDYCHPDNYRAPAVDVLYRNLGNGAFLDVSKAAGIGAIQGNGLGIVDGDFNQDGWLDFYIANDGNPNRLWINQGNGTFADQGTISGSAVNRQGQAEAGMGVVAFDLGNDSDLDLFMTHLRGETNTLYRNDGNSFQDITALARLATPSISLTGFGVGYYDFDNNGHGDLYVVNGRVGRSGQPDAEDPFSEPNLLFSGTGEGTFEEVVPKGGTSPSLIATSRAAAFADFDNDGKVDLAIVNNGGPLHLLRNVVGDQLNWVGFDITRLEWLSTSGMMVGIYAGGSPQWVLAGGGGSYQASNDHRIHVGLGQHTAVDSVKVAIPGQAPYALKGPFRVGEYILVENVESQ